LQNRFTENSESADYDGGKNIFKSPKTSVLLETGQGVNEKKCAVMQKFLDKTDYPVLYCFLTICP
jgi:hypothetical protein